MFEPFQKFIPRAANKHGVSRQITAAHVCQEFRKIMPDAFAKLTNPGEAIQPAHFRNGTLTISTASPAWAQEVIMRKTKIIAEMNTRLGKKVIKNLRTQLYS